MTGWNGSGGFTRPHDYTADLAAGVPDSTVSATKVDADFDNIATGMQNCLTRDGQNSPSANINFGGYKITNLGTPSAGTDAATKTYADSVIPTQTSNSGKFLTTNGTSTSWSTVNAAGLASDAVTTVKILDANVTTAKIADSNVTTAKIANSAVTKAKIENVANMKVLGNVSGSSAAPAEVSLLDEDNMASNSATALATQQSIKAYVDAAVAASSAYTSAEVTVAANDTGTITHNLGTLTPKVEVYLVCKSSEYGFVTGDEIGPITLQTEIFGANRSYAWRATSSNAIGYRIADGGFVLIRYDNGSSAAITAGSWRAKFVVEAR